MARHSLPESLHSRILPLKTILGCGVVLIALSGCAGGRSELDLYMPPVSAVASKQAVTIVEIRDLREFEVNPADPTHPSLAAPADIENEEKTARTIGRKSNSYGARVGEVTLPAGQTVAGVVRRMVTNALQEKGYVVVADASPGILPVSIDIEKFWAWFTPGAFEATLQFESAVKLYGPGVFELDSTRIEVGSSMRTASATDTAWGRVVRHGLDNLAMKVRNEVDPATSRTSLATAGPDNATSIRPQALPLQPMPAPAAAPMPQSMSQPIPQSMTQPVPRPMPQSMPQPMAQPVPQPMPQSMSQPPPQPMTAPMQGPATIYYAAPAPAATSAPPSSVPPSAFPAAPPSISSPALQPCDASSYELSQACDASATEVR